MASVLEAHAFTFFNQAKRVVIGAIGECAIVQHKSCVLVVVVVNASYDTITTPACINLLLITLNKILFTKSHLTVSYFFA